MKSERIKHCRVCKNNDLVKVLNLGRQPLANLFLKTPNTHEEKYPLDVYLCENCGHAQLGTVVDREGIFSNYIYFTAQNSPTSEHFRKYADNVKKRVPSWKNDLIVEIGSNDGLLLEEFGHKNVLGIDPAENIKADVPTWREFFTKDTATRIIAQKKKKAKIIMANNVLAHTFDLADMLEAMYQLLDDDGLIIVESPWIGDMFLHNAYDTIYHEHLSYFSISALINLFSLHSFVIVDLEFHPVQGKSFRIFVKKKGHGKISKIAQRISKEEFKKGWTKKKSFIILDGRIKKSKEILLEKLKKFKSENKIIVGYGAPAKGNTIVNYSHCGKYLDYFTDVMPSKIGLYTPGSHLEVRHREDINPDVFVLFPWNYKKYILTKEKKFKGEWIIPNQL